MFKNKKTATGIIITTVIIVLLLFNSCRPNSKTGLNKSITQENNLKADSIWNAFEQALENQQIDFLILNSFDSIKCSELQTQNPDSNELYNARFIFENHIDQLKHLDILSTQKRQIYMDDSIIRVNFLIDCKEAEENGYNLIFMFEKSGEKYLFSGMVLT